MTAARFSIIWQPYKDASPTLAAPTLEVALLDGAAYLREHHGLGPSRVALTTATKLSPASSMIRCDLIATCWSLLSSADKNERQFLLRQIASAYRPADLDIVDPGAVQQLLYAALVAFHFLPDSEDSLGTLLASESVRRITDKWYVDRIRALLSTPVPSLDDSL